MKFYRKKIYDTNLIISHQVMSLIIKGTFSAAQSPEKKRNKKPVHSLLRSKKKYEELEWIVDRNVPESFQKGHNSNKWHSNQNPILYNSTPLYINSTHLSFVFISYHVRFRFSFRLESNVINNNILTGKSNLFSLHGRPVIKFSWVGSQAIKAYLLRQRWVHVCPKAIAHGQVGDVFANGSDGLRRDIGTVDCG